MVTSMWVEHLRCEEIGKSFDIADAGFDMVDRLRNHFRVHSNTAPLNRHKVSRVYVSAWRSPDGQEIKSRARAADRFW
jgi:hypothetical protein